MFKKKLSLMVVGAMLCGIPSFGVSAEEMVTETIDTSVQQEEVTEVDDEQPNIEKAEMKLFIGGELKEIKVKSEEEKKKEEYDKELDKELKATKNGKGYSYKIPETWRSEFKSYMRYTAVTSKSSPQYKLLNSEDAYTDDNGLRLYKGRYCIAMGSGFADKIGTKIDLILSNGTILQCILGDQKANCDTTKNNMCCKSNGSIAEFIVDYSVFLGKKDGSGTVNWIKNFDGKIDKVVVYNGKDGSEEIKDEPKKTKTKKKKKKVKKEKVEVIETSEEVTTEETSEEQVTEEQPTEQSTEG